MTVGEEIYNFVRLPPYDIHKIVSTLTFVFVIFPPQEDIDNHK